MNTEFKTLCAEWGLGEVQEEPKEVTGGLLHKMYRVKTDKGEYAVKWLNPDIMARPKAYKNMLDSEKIAEQFSTFIPLILAKRYHGSCLAEADGQYYFFYNWIEGASVFAPEITEVHCEQIGRLLGKLHAADIFVEGVEKQTDVRQRYDWEFMVLKAKEQNEESYTLLEEHLEDMRRWDEKAVVCQKEVLKKQVISHRDLDPKNVMWSERKPYLIDWEAAGYTNPYSELIEVLRYWISDEEGNYSKEKFEIMIKAYTENCRIADVNWEMILSYSLDGMLGWLWYSIRRMLGIEGSSKADREEGRQQVEGTIKELLKYELQMKQIKQWLEEWVS